MVRALGLASGIGVPLVVLVSSGALAGHYLDGKLDRAPWFTIGGIVLGSVAALVNMVRVVNWYLRLEDDSSHDGSKHDTDGT